MKVKNVLKFLSSILLFISLVYTIGCNNSITGPTASNVSFTIGQQNGTTGVQFLAKPSIDVKLTKVISYLQSANYYDTVPVANTNYTFSKDSFYVISEYNGVATGQKWSFTFFGSAAASGTAFTATASYTVQ